MLATRGDRVPDGAEWTHEVKWDGMRVLADRTGDGLRLTSRNENPVTGAFPELADVAAGRDLLLDGEVVAFADGIPSFDSLAERIHVSKPGRARLLAERQPVTYLIFDVLRLDGRDLASLPLGRRREILVGLDLTTPRWQVPPWYGDGAMLWAATRQQRLEGVVSKRLGSPYRFGARSRHWLKFPHRRRSSWVIGGWRPEVDTSHRLGAVLVGEPTPEGLIYRGRVGSGIAGKVGPPLLGLLAPLQRPTSPFVDDVPRPDAVGVTWVEPVLVIDVEALGMSGHARLRQPSYRGLRTDLTPEDLRDGRETP